MRFWHIKATSGQTELTVENDREVMDIAKTGSLVKYVGRLRADERSCLEGTIRTGRDAAYRLLKARILLKADASLENGGCDNARIAAALDTSASTVLRTRRQFGEEGLEAALARTTRQTSPTPRIFDGQAEARLLQLACSEPPEGHVRWSLRLPEKRVVELSTLDRQHLARRIPDRGKLEEQTRAWETPRNKCGTAVEWRFSTEDARMKLATSIRR